MSSQRSFRIGIDVGGTFTDVVAITPDDALVTLKTPSIPRDPALAVLNGVDELAARLGIKRSRLLEAATVVHGTTIGINTLLTRTGARTALLTTAGFRDILEMRLAYKEDRYDLAKPQPEPLVARRLRIPVRERVNKDGVITIPIQEEDVRASCETLRAENVEAIAICFLWSFRNPAHEELTADICRSELPGVYVSCSTDVFPEIREYDRVSTTVLNAYIGPRVAAYVDRLESSLGEAGLERPVRYLQSNGGTATGDEVRRVPVRTLLSGPAAGPVAARSFAARENLICVDMGGTSFDVSVITGGTVRESRPVDIDSVRMGLPMIDVHTIGGGGGSIAEVDAGLLRVGPASAGADPGPAAYSRGGSDPTVTDANLTLGLYAPSELTPGLSLSTDGASAALAALGGDLGLGAVAAAEAVWRLINLNLADATREVTVREGRDPRAYTLVAGGGSGPAHACAIADELHVGRVVVPKVAGTLCAFGAVATDLAYESRRSYPSVIGSTVLPDDVESVFAQLEAEVEARIDDTDEGERYLDRFAELRYRDQLWEIRIEAPQRPVTDGALREWVDRFHRRHHELYTYAEETTACELVSLVVRGGVKQVLPTIDWGRATDESVDWGQRPSRQVYLTEWEASGQTVEVPVYGGDSAPMGAEISGPAIIDEEGFVIVVPPTWRCAFGGGAYELTKEFL